MAYKKDWVASPNFTPAAQTQAFYGRPRSISGGAGHWWNWPRSGARHAGIVSYMAQASRQAAPHAVVSAGWVTEMVRDHDTAWCTGAANPYTWALEIDPRIMFKWGYDNPSAAERKLGNEIFETVCEYIADKGYHNLPWKPHNVWAPGTQCNPLRYNEIMARAKQIRAAKNAPKPTITWVKLDKPRKMVALRDTRVYELPAQKAIGSTIKRGAKVDIATKTSGGSWYRSAYSTQQKLNHGLKSADFGEVPVVAPTPEWQKNLKDIKPLKLMVLPANGTSIIDLNKLTVISPLAKGTYVDFTKSTTVKGKEYLISKYSAERAMPNGILRSDVGVPAEPPKQEKPSWLDKWEDIANVKMYLRVDAPLVNLLDGSTVKVLPKGTEFEVGSTTLWLEDQYAISEWSTGRKEPRGVLIRHLDNDPIKEPEAPVEPAPEQPEIQPVDTNSVIAFLEMLAKLITEFVNKLRK